MRYEEDLRHIEPGDAMEQADAAARVAIRVEREHRERYGAAALTAELAEERERAAAAGDDDAWVLYEAKWRRKLRRLQHAYPERWRVPGLSEEEVRDILTLRLMEVVRAEQAELSRYRRPGKTWAMLCFQQHLRSLRKSFGLHAIAADFNTAPILQHAPDQEQQWLDLEADRERALAGERAELGLSRPQRQWLAALKLSADAGAFFASSEQPNLTAASRVLGKNRSSAQRAYRELQGRFIRERNRFG